MAEELEEEEDIARPSHQANVVSENEPEGSSRRWARFAQEVPPYAAWGLLVAGSGQAGITDLIHGDFAHAATSFGCMVAVMAVLLWRKPAIQWISGTSPNYAFLAAALVLQATLLMP